VTGDASMPDGLAARWARRVLRPVIGILIRSGLQFREFSAIARSVYVEVAGEEFGIRGRRTNTSRIALLTGLSRAQAKRELDLMSTSPVDEPTDHVRPASRTLLGWYTDARFLGDDGQPRPLSLSEPDDFPSLYESYSGKVVPVTTMVKELINVGAVEQLPDGRLLARSRSYTPGQSDPQALLRIGYAISDLAATAHHNLHAAGDQRRRFERFATNQLIDAQDVPLFQDYLEAEGQAFLERADNWLSQREIDADEGDLVRIGVGVYQILTEPIEK